MSAGMPQGPAAEFVLGGPLRNLFSPGRESRFACASCPALSAVSRAVGDHERRGLERDARVSRALPSHTQRSTGPRHMRSGGTRLMARRPDLTRIDAARREATRQRLLSTGMLPERVDALMAASEAEAGRRGLAGGRRYADEIGWEWMVAQRARQ